MPSILDPELLKCAKFQAWGGRTYIPGSDSLQKSAVVPPGGGDPAAAGGMPPGGDPAAAGGAPPPPGGDPMAAPPPGGDAMSAPPQGPGGGMDPNTISQIATQVAAMMGGGAGGAGGAPGAAGPGGMKPPTKKVDPAILDTKMWQIMKMLALMLEHFQISIPADLALGPPPDPMQMQTAMQDQQTAMAGGAPAGAPAPADPSMAPPAPGGAPPGGDPMAAGGAPPAGGGSMAPIEPMQPAPTPGKQASDRVRFGQEVRPQADLSAAGKMTNLAKLARSIAANAN